MSGINFYWKSYKIFCEKFSYETNVIAFSHENLHDCLCSGKRQSVMTFVMINTKLCGMCQKIISSHGICIN